MIDYTSPITQRVLLSIFAVLGLASLIGWGLARKNLSEKGRSTVENLNARTKSWWVMVILLLVSLSMGKWGCVTIFFLISFLALREYITATPTRKADHLSLFAAFFIALPFQYYLVGTQWYGLFTIMIPVYAFVLIPILTVIQGDAQDFLSRNARTQWGLMVCVYFISHIPMLLTLPFDDARLPMGTAGLVLFFITIIQGSDVLQYVWGKLKGKRPIAPKLSPNKTIEGFVGGVLSASLIGVALHRITPFSPVQAFFISLMLCLLGFFGGLIMSAIKRERGIKDWGNLIEGHGGMMDRIDSLCFAAPLYFHIIRYYFVGSY